MKSSLQFRIALAGTIFIVVIAALTISISIFFFKNEVKQLYQQDFQSRLRGIEYEYADIDALSAASDEVARLQEQLLEQLSRRFENETGVQPFIINGNLELILWPDALKVDKEYASEIVGRADGAGRIDTVLNTNAGDYWCIASYYVPWDWYTGYAVAESRRFGILTTFFSIISMVTLAVALVAILSYFLILRSALNPLKLADAAIARYTEGDLRERIPVKREDEAGRIAGGVNQFADRLSTIVGSIKDSSKQNQHIEKQLGESSNDAADLINKITGNTGVITSEVAELTTLMNQSDSSVEKIADEIAKLTERIQEQSSAVNQSTASIEEMNSSLSNVAAITQAKKASSSKLIQTARESGERLEQTNSAIQLMLSRVDSISEFVSVIQNIASQTNLLAMNAAIEAAHAGESGRGFAVVADEIRKLAEKAGSQSKEISTGIKEIVDSINTAAESGEHTRTAFQEIEQEIQTVVNSLEEINSSTSELTIGSEEVMNAMQVLQEISVDVKSGADSVNSEASTVQSALKQLASLSEKVRRLTATITEQAGSAEEVIAHVSEASEQLRQATRTLSDQVAVFTIEETEAPAELQEVELDAKDAE
jgi:methyl-accepting chemotaxis protein